MSPTIRQRSMIFSMDVPRGLRLNSTIPDETPRFQVAWNRSAAAGARKPCIQDTRDVGNFL
jgi:hypothetical protein